MSRVRVSERFGIAPEGLFGPVFANSRGRLWDKHNTLAQWWAFRKRAGLTFRTFRRPVRHPERG